MQDETNKERQVVYELTTETFVTVDPMIGMKGITPYTFS